MAKLKINKTNLVMINEQYDKYNKEFNEWNQGKIINADRTLEYLKYLMKKGLPKEELI